ncbi:MAG: thiamine phosphate synthase [Pseudolactococcus laudensis]
MIKSIDYSLYLVTDSELMLTERLEEAVEQAILGGVTVVQLREKKANSKTFLEQALRVKKVTGHYQTPLIINDRVDIALAIDANGVV